jgi:hypothetical protein
MEEGAGGIGTDGLSFVFFSLTLIPSSVLPDIVNKGLQILLLPFMFSRMYFTDSELPDQLHQWYGTTYILAEGT